MADAFRWTHDKALSRAGDEQVTKGDVFTPTEAEHRAFGDRIEAVEAVEDDESDDADTEAPFNPADYSVRELRDHVADTAYTEGERDALVTAEESGKDRTSAVDILEP